MIFIPSTTLYDAASVHNFCNFNLQLYKAINCKFTHKHANTDPVIQALPYSSSFLLALLYYKLDVVCNYSSYINIQPYLFIMIQYTYLYD